MATLDLKNINKIYDNNVQAVFDFNLHIEDKEFIVFVGPSGCGKSTTLRMIAGLEDISSGELYIDDEKMNDVLPKDRNIAMVFQSYALYPHMTVYDNMAFGLKLKRIPVPKMDKEGNPVLAINKKKIASLKKELKNIEVSTTLSERDKTVKTNKLNAELQAALTTPEQAYKYRKMPKAEIDEKVRNAAQILGIERYLDRKPKALSGGQRQRVALGRAIVRNAKVFLMDEPLSNLDAKLRVVMRGEITKLHNKIGATTIYVTHDQIEAMTMASRIVVMKDGYIQQVGTPAEIYNYPANLFVAGFIGTPPMNFLEGVVNEDGYFISSGNDAKLKVSDLQYELIKSKGYIGKTLTIGIRAEHIHDTEEALLSHPESQITVKVDVSELLGQSTNVYSKVSGCDICAVVRPRTDLKPGDMLTLAVDIEKCHFFDTETTNRIAFEK